jgi:hypothetical protein
MSKPDTPNREAAHDVLAAEAFAVPTRDPSLEPAHDVLAADEFALPGRDPSLGHDPVVLPADPSGIAEPHDVLAAEEFAMPAIRPAADAVRLARRHSRSVWRLLLAAAAGALLARILTRSGRRG